MLNQHPARPFYYLPNARTEEQAARMGQLEADGVCIFCPGDLGGQQVVHRTWHWRVARNAYPYDGTRLHLLVVPFEHVGDLADLPADAWSELRDVLRWIRDAYNLTAYGLCSRNGDCAATGASIAHVHGHVIVPGDGAVRFRVG